jgi:hypothetical protein
MTLLDQIRARANPDALFLAQIIHELTVGNVDAKCHCHQCTTLRPLYTPLTVTSPFTTPAELDTMQERKT